MNLYRGFKRIVWVLSISASIGIWCYFFVTADLKKDIPYMGLDLISLLDEKPEMRDRLDMDEVEKDLPTLNIRIFRLRYGLIPDSLTDPEELAHAKSLPPVDLFERHVEMWKVATVILLGFLPFVASWLLWFLVNWIIRGFGS